LADLPCSWDDYAHLQAALLRGCQITDRTWGLEEALNRVLASLQDNKPLKSDEIARAAASGGRRERHRARLRIVHLADNGVPAHPEDVLATRHELHVARAKVSEWEWSVLCQVAAGYDYAELASANGGTPGSMRVRVLRLRRQLKAA